MIYFLIPVIIILGIVLGLMFVPYPLRPLAKNANFGLFSISYLKLRLQKMPVKFLFEQYVKALEVNVALDFSDLRDYFQTSGEEKTATMVNVLIRAKRAGVRIDINDLEKFEISGGNPEQLVKALKVVKNADVDVSRDVLESHSLYGGDIAAFVEIILRAKKANLKLDLQSLVEENLSDAEMKKIVDILIKAQKAGLYVSDNKMDMSDEAKGENQNADLRISQQSILGHFRANIDIEKYANAMIRAKKSGIELDKHALEIHYLTDGDMEKLVNTMIKAERADLNITQKELVEHNVEGRDIGKIVKNIIKAKQAGLDLTIDELIDFHRIGGDVDDFVKALISAKKNHLGIGKKELEEHFLAGANIKEYVKARKIVADNKQLGLTKEDLDMHYIRGGHLLKVLFALMYARQNNIDFPAGMALKFDLIYDINEILDWAINPQVFKVKNPVTIVGKDGVQITPKLTVTVRGKIALYVKGSKEEVLFGRINEAVAEEVLYYDGYKETLNNLNKISENVRRRMQGKLKPQYKDGVSKYEIEDETAQINETEQKLNASSAYEVLDIKIYDIEIGTDTLADFKTHHAEHEKHLAEIHLEEKIAHAKADEAVANARLAEAKAKVEEGVAEGFRTGTMNMSDKLKREILFSKETDTQHGRQHDGNAHGKGNKHH